jgi:nitroimidazol reductase NimA-like FMN-containing flavoprotein (pyridoxamine 5'-phosphate oxidase superfamily)
MQAPFSQSTRARRSVSDNEPGTEMTELSREECLQLLKTQSFGRLAVNTGKGPPVIRPVNYAFDESSQSIVFRTADGSKFHALLQSAQAAFEVDRVEGGSHTGWSVIVHGVTDEVTHPSEVRRLDNLGLEPWAPGHKPHWVHIRAWTVSGRRIVMAADNVPGHRA